MISSLARPASSTAAVFAHTREIAGAEKIACEGDAREVRLVEVAVHDERCSDLQFADCIDRQFAALIVGDAELALREKGGRWSRRTSRAHARDQEEIRAAGLGQAVDVNDTGLWQEFSQPRSVRGRMAHHRSVSCRD